MAAAVSDRLPGPRIRIRQFDPNTGNPAAVASEAAPAEPGNCVQRALDHVRNIGSALGFAEAPEYVPDPDFQKTSGGRWPCTCQQSYKEIPIFQAAETVRSLTSLESTSTQIVTV